MAAMHHVAPTYVVSCKPSSPALERTVRRRESGFCAFAVCVVLFLVSLAAFFAVPVVQTVRRDKLARATLSELKSFETAFMAYAQSKANWPEGTALPGEYPPGMEPVLNTTRWQSPAPIGGRYVWLTDTRQRGARVHAAIGICSYTDDRVTVDPRLLASLQQLAADAGLDARRLRLGFRNEPIYILEY